MSKEAAPPIPYLGQIHPPYPDAVNPMQATTVGAKIFSTIGMLIFLGVVWVITWGIGGFFEWKWFKYISAVICVFLYIAVVKGILKSQRAICPFCNRQIGNEGLTLQITDENKQICCEHCHEWLLSNAGEIRAFRETDVKDQKDFDCLAFEKGVWPNECVVCGAPPTRFLEANTRKFNAASLAIGRISVSSGGIKGIPYCEAHEDAVAVKIKDDKVHIVFDNYSARRRFLHVNRLRAGETA